MFIYQCCILGAMVSDWAVKAGRLGLPKNIICKICVAFCYCYDSNACSRDRQTGPNRKYSSLCVILLYVAYEYDNWRVGAQSSHTVQYCCSYKCVIEPVKLKRTQDTSQNTHIHQLPPLFISFFPIHPLLYITWRLGSFKSCHFVWFSEGFLYILL